MTKNKTGRVRVEKIFNNAKTEQNSRKKTTRTRKTKTGVHEERKLKGKTGWDKNSGQKLNIKGKRRWRMRVRLEISRGEKRCEAQLFSFSSGPALSWKCFICSVSAKVISHSWNMDRTLIVSFCVCLQGVTPCRFTNIYTFIYSEKRGHKYLSLFWQQKHKHKQH